MGVKDHHDTFKEVSTLLASPIFELDLEQLIQKSIDYKFKMFSLMWMAQIITQNLFIREIYDNIWSYQTGGRFCFL